MTAPTTTDIETELSAVNSILGAIGQSPVTTLGTYSEITGEKSYTQTAVSGTYARSGTTVTVTKAAHGLSTGDKLTIDFTSPSTTATDGTYLITKTGDDTFTVTDSASGTIAGGSTLTYLKHFFDVGDVTFTSSDELKATLDGVAETGFTVSGSTVIFTTAPAANVVVRIYREQDLYHTESNPEVAFIYNLLREANIDVQNEGWHFNTEHHQKFSPDGDKYITFPNDALRLDITDGWQVKSKDVVKRNGRLYDKVHHTDEFDTDVYCDIVRLYAFEDVPESFKRYITYKAAARAATQLVANQELTKLLSSQEALAKATCIEYECNQGNHSFFGTPDNSAYTTYQPWRTFRRS